MGSEKHHFPHRFIAPCLTFCMCVRLMWAPPSAPRILVPSLLSSSASHCLQTTAHTGSFPVPGASSAWLHRRESQGTLNKGTWFQPSCLLLLDAPELWPAENHFLNCILACGLLEHVVVYTSASKGVWGLYCGYRILRGFFYLKLTRRNRRFLAVPHLCGHTVYPENFHSGCCHLRISVLCTWSYCIH